MNKTIEKPQYLLTRTSASSDGDALGQHIEIALKAEEHRRMWFRDVWGIPVWPFLGHEYIISVRPRVPDVEAVSVRFKHRGSDRKKLIVADRWPEEILGHIYLGGSLLYEMALLEVIETSLVLQTT